MQPNHTARLELLLFHWLLITDVGFPENHFANILVATRKIYIPHICTAGFFFHLFVSWSSEGWGFVVCFVMVSLLWERCTLSLSCLA